MKSLNFYHNLICGLWNCRGSTELVDGKINIADMKEINIIDLLGRDPVDPVPELFSKNIRDQNCYGDGSRWFYRF